MEADAVDCWWALVQHARATYVLDASNDVSFALTCLVTIDDRRWRQDLRVEAVVQGDALWLELRAHVCATGAAGYPLAPAAAAQLEVARLLSSADGYCIGVDVPVLEVGLERFDRLVEQIVNEAITVRRGMRRAARVSQLFTFYGD